LNEGEKKHLPTAWNLGRPTEGWQNGGGTGEAGVPTEAFKKRITKIQRGRGRKLERRGGLKDRRILGECARGGCGGTLCGVTRPKKENTKPSLWVQR